MIRGDSIKTKRIVKRSFSGQWLCGSVGRAVASIAEVHGSNPVIGKNLFILNICLLSTVYLKDENKEKEAGNGPFLKRVFQSGPRWWSSGQHARCQLRPSEFESR